MKKLFALLVLISLLTGCVLVPTDFMPKFAWYWSAEAKAHRAQVHAEKEWQRTNQLAAPKK